jgi:hypothetical protein
LALLLTSCGSKPQDLIVGKWQSTDAKEPGTIEFTKDGNINIVNGPMTLKATYKFLDDKNIEMEIQNPFGGMGIDIGGKKMDMPKMDMPGLKQKVGIAVSKDELTMTNEKGQTTKFKRAN